MRERRIMLTLALTGLVLAGCGGGGSKLGAAFCNDLEAGASPAAILAPRIQDGTYSPQEAADRAYAWAAGNCSDQLKTNEGLRSYLENWNIDPDA